MNMKITLEECKRRMDANNGSLYLSHAKITSLPEGLSVRRSLNLSHTKITSLPEGLTVGEHLDLSYTKITKLPDSLRVGGKIYCDFPIDERKYKKGV